MSEVVRRVWANGLLRRTATTAVFWPVLLACFLIVSQPSLAQTCEWDRFPEPSAGSDAIEVHRHGGYGPGAGRTLVSIDASGRLALLARGQCPDRTLLGRLAAPIFDELMEELRRALESARQPARPESRCQSPDDGVDLDVTVYRDGAKEHYPCVTGALLRFGEGVLARAFDAVCANPGRTERAATVCVERRVSGQ